MNLSNLFDNCKMYLKGFHSFICSFVHLLQIILRYFIMYNYVNYEDCISEIIMLTLSPVFSSFLSDFPGFSFVARAVGFVLFCFFAIESVSGDFHSTEQTMHRRVNSLVFNLDKSYVTMIQQLLFSPLPISFSSTNSPLPYRVDKIVFLLFFSVFLEAVHLFRLK